MADKPKYPGMALIITAVVVLVCGTAVIIGVLAYALSRWLQAAG